jgi:hypothetical protein
VPAGPGPGDESIPPKRTVRLPNSWTPDEWIRGEERRQFPPPAFLPFSVIARVDTGETFEQHREQETRRTDARGRAAPETIPLPPWRTIRGALSLPASLVARAGGTFAYQIVGFQNEAGRQEEISGLVARRGLGGSRAPARANRRRTPLVRARWSRSKADQAGLGTLSVGLPNSQHQKGTSNRTEGPVV